MSYATELTAIKRLALQTLFAILQTATDHAELRRAATAILRIPDPKPETQSKPECNPESEPPVKPASESVGLIVSSRGVERGSASDTPGMDATNESHSEGVLVAPALASSLNATPNSDPALATRLIAHHPRPAAALRAAAGAPRSLTAPELPFSSAPMLPCSPAP